jgi:alcohol dehydrogenase-like protein
MAPPLTGVEHIEKASDARPNEGIPLPGRGSPSPQQQITSDSISSDSDDDSTDQVFYTPFSSPPTSMFIDPAIPLLPPAEPTSSLSPDDKSSSSSASSTSSTSSTSHSALSGSTPPTSDELHAAFAALQKRPPRQSRSKRISTPSKSYTYTDEDWAKEFRWLVQPSSSAPKRRTDLDVPQSAFPPTVAHKPKTRPRQRTVISRPIPNHRMTALLEEDEDASDDLRSSSPQSHLRSPFSPPLSRTNSITSNSPDARSASHASHSRTISLSSRTVELPQFPSSSAPGPAPGYTTLTLPRASYRPEDPWRSLGGGHINLPRDGRAQASMVSVEVVRGAASASFLSSGFRKRNSASPPHKKHDLAGAIALSSHRPPPSFVPNSGVLVQVHAIGLEGLDRQIVIDKLAESDAGGKGATSFIPGRGVLGRVVECGLEVSTDTLKKGEWVIGLLDAKKVRCHRVCSPGVFVVLTNATQCGALSEFVLLDRHHVHRAPQPSIHIPTHSPADPLPSFSLESLALLSVLGVPAYRAIRTYTASKSPLSSRGGTALILRGQDGAGGLATLMLRAIGVNVIVQVDPSSVGYGPTTAPSQPYLLFSASDDKVLGTGTPRRLQEVCARLRAWDVEGICVGSPLAVIEVLDVDVDFVIDTIGGREIWYTARDLLARGTASRGPAQFTTIVGDAGSGKAVPTAQDHWRAGVRSLKRAMTINRSSRSSGFLSLPGGRSFPAKKVRRSLPSPMAPPARSASVPPVATSPRTVNYTWVSCLADVDFEGGDVRDALATLLTMHALQNLSPDALLGLGGEYGAGRVLPFERAPEAFGGSVLEGGGTAVIRVVV